MSKEAEELARLKLAIQEYTRWLSPEFPDVVLVLENLQAVGEGKKSLCASTPPSSQGPWTILGLRDTLRARRVRDN